MNSDRNCDACLHNFPVAKPTFDPNDAPFVGSLPETLRSFRRAVGYDLKFLRAGSVELDAVRREEQAAEFFAECDKKDVRVASFPIANENAKTYGFLVLRRDSGLAPKLDWEPAKAIAESLAATLSDVYRWRAKCAEEQGELAVLAVRDSKLQPKPKAAFSVRLREILRVGARALGDFDAAALYLLDDATTELTPRALWGLPDERFLDKPRSLQNARADVEALMGSVVVVNDDYLSEAWNAPEDFQCSVCVPIASDTTILGVAWFFANKKRAIETRELETLNLVAGRIVDQLEKEAIVLRGPLFENQEKKESEKSAKIIESASEEEFNDVVESILSSLKF